jgi:hypothetical protein
VTKTRHPLPTLFPADMPTHITSYQVRLPSACHRTSDLSDVTIHIRPTRTKADSSLLVLPHRPIRTPHTEPLPSTSDMPFPLDPSRTDKPNPYFPNRPEADKPSRTMSLPTSQASPNRSETDYSSRLVPVVHLLESDLPLRLELGQVVKLLTQRPFLRGGLSDLHDPTLSAHQVEAAVNEGIHTVGGFPCGLGIEHGHFGFQVVPFTDHV